MRKIIDPSFSRELGLSLVLISLRRSYFNVAGSIEIIKIIVIKLFLGRIVMPCLVVSSIPAWILP